MSPAEAASLSTDTGRKAPSGQARRFAEPGEEAPRSPFRRRTSGLPPPIPALIELHDEKHRRLVIGVDDPRQRVGVVAQNRLVGADVREAQPERVLRCLRAVHRLVRRGPYGRLVLHTRTQGLLSRERVARGMPVAVPAVVALILGLWGLDRRSMFGSEADTYWAARLSVPHLFRLLRHIDAVHGLYYLFMHGWLTVNASPEWMRVPSVIGMVGSAALTSVIATRVSGSRGVGLVAGLLLAFVPALGSWGQNGRSYTLVALCVAATVLALLRATEEHAGRPWPRWVLFGAMLTLTGYLHEMTLLLSIAFGITLLSVRTPRAVMTRWFITTAVAGLLVAPLLVVSARERAAVNWLRAPGVPQLMNLFHVYFGTSDVIAYMLFGCALIGALPRTRSSRRASPHRSITPAALAVPMLVVPAGLLMAESRVVHPFYDVRYVLYASIGAALLAAAGLDRIASAALSGGRPALGRSSPILRTLPGLAVCVATIVVQWPTQQYLRTPASRGEDYAAASNYLARHDRRGDGVVFMKRTARSAKLGYPSQYRGLDDFALAKSPEQAGTFLGVTRSPAQVRAAITAQDRIWVLGPYPLSKSPFGLAGSAYLLRTAFRPTLIHRFAGVTDVLYVRKSGPPGRTRS